MPFGSNLANRATSEWQDYLKKIQAQQASSPNALSSLSGPPTGIPGLGQSPNAPRDASYPGAPSQMTMQSTSPNASQSGTPQAINSSTKESPGGTGTIGDNTVVRPGQWYSDMGQAAVAKLSQDPARAVDLWAKKTGKGGAYGQMLNSMIDPVSALRLMGADAGVLSQMNNRPLDQMSQLWRVMAGESDYAGNNRYVDPTGMLSNVLNAKYSKNDPALSLGQSVGNPNIIPEEQISNTMGLVLSGLQGFVSDSALNAYATMLQQASMDFLNMKESNPNEYDSNLTFNAYLKQRFGSGGGLF